MSKSRIVVAMSGGVDSTTVAALLKAEGHDVIGITMQLLEHRDSEGGCCSLDNIIDARKASNYLGIPHYVVNFTDMFNELVMRDYVDKYNSGKTPIPCVLCNQHIKFDLLLKRAKELGADYLATGHYARVVKEADNGPYKLSKAVDESKDQTYFLYTLTQNELPYLMFPLGGMTKKEVRQIAKELSIKVAEKPDSTGVCFVPTGNYRDFLSEQGLFNEEQGEIVDTEGSVLGSHRGLYSYTVGQRRGLGIALGRPAYVVELDPSRNRVVVGDQDKIYRSSLVADSMTWVTEPPGEDTTVSAKVRYRHPEDEASIEFLSEEGIKVDFKKPQRAITPGQAVVFYKGESVLGGGWIKEVLSN